MNKEDIKEYIKLLRKFNNGNLDNSIEEKQLIQKYDNLWKTDITWRTLIDRLKEVKDEEEQNKIVETFLSYEKEVENNKPTYQTINQVPLELNTSGIDILQTNNQNGEQLIENNAETSEKPKVHIFKKDNKGFADAALLSLITGFFGGMVTTMVIELLKIKSM